MGLLDWFFGKKDQSVKKPAPPKAESRQSFKMLGPILLFGREEYLFDVVGEASHQAELEEIAGGKIADGLSHECVASIGLDNGNPHHDSAVAVSIKGKVVGYFPRPLAKQYREWLQDWDLSEESVSCRALIVGGRESGPGDTGNYGVKLDIELPFKPT